MNNSEIIETSHDTSQFYFFTVLYIILDYARIYQVVHLGFMRPMLILMAILIFFIINGGQYHRTKNRQVTYMWLFILLLGCHIPFAQNNHLAYIAASTQLLYMPFILSVIITVNSFSRLQKFILILICIEVYIAIYALTHAGYGPGNYFEDENDLALYINLWIPFCYFLFFSYEKLLPKLICLTGLVVGIFSIVVSFSRGGFIGLIATGAVIWFFSRRKVIATLMIMVLVSMMMIFAEDKYWDEMSTSTSMEEDSTGKERIESWKSGIFMFIDNPFGVGGNNYPVRFPEYQTEYFQRGMYGRAAHSIWFTLIPELGVIGIFIYAMLLFYNLKDIFRLKNISFHDDSKGIDKEKKFLNYTGRAFIASLVGFFATGTFLSVLYYAHYWYLTGLIAASAAIMNEYADRAKENQINKEQEIF